ncbi:MAG: hypothetical protein DRJ03_03490 [Chloroflexi bacterium]|nr:MAG: hypothetical protein DRJ03_03490 [Chloroflexota bacterium]
MKRILYALPFLLIASQVFAFDDIWVQGKQRADVDILSFDAMSAPSVSGLGEARMYFDATANKLKCSENGGAYADCVGGGGTALTVQDIDGTPTVNDVDTIRFTNGSVADDGGGQVTVTTGAGGGGDVSGPASSVDNEIVRFDSTTGKVIQAYTSGGPTISDTGTITITQPLILDDTSFQVQEGGDTMTLTVPALTAARAVTLPDAAGEISLLGQSISDAEVDDDITIDLATAATTAGTVTTAAQPNITSVGTLTILDVDNLRLNGNDISSTAGTDLTITPLAGQQIVLDGTIVVDAGVVTGATSITSTAFVGALTGNADTASALAANGANCGVATQFAVGVDADGAAECEAIADADVPDTITIDNATTAANLGADGVDALTEIAQGIKTAANDTSKVVVGTAAGAVYCAQWDGSGNLTDSGSACGAGGGATAWDDIGDPDAEGTIAFGDYEQLITTTLDDATAGIEAAVTLQNTDGSLTNDSSLLDLIHTDDGDPDTIFIQAFDNTSDLKFQVAQDGKVDINADDSLDSAGPVVSVTFDSTSITDMTLLDLIHTDDGDAQGTFIEAFDNTSDLKFQVAAEGAILSASLAGGGTQCVQVDNTGLLAGSGGACGGAPATADISDVSVTQTELAELETIGATTISAAQWAGLGGATTAGIALWDDADNVAQLVTLGLTATASEINTPLDGASVTLTEFQELETIGATTISANQWATLGGIAETLGSAELDILDGATLSVGDLNIIDGISDSGTLTAAELLYVDGVTSAIQTQLDGKLSLTGGTLTGEVTVDNLGLEFTAGDDHSDCSAFSATGGGIYFDDSEGKFKKCQDNVLTDLDTSGGFTDLDTDYGAETVTSDFDFGGGVLQVPNSTSLPGTCEVGDSYMDTDATSGSRWYLCESANTWKAQGGSGGGTAMTEVRLPVQSAKITGSFVTDQDATQGAQIDAGDGNWRLLFDPTTDEAAVWQFRMPANYSSGPVLKAQYSMTSATSGTVEYEGAIMCVSDGDAADVGTASFSTIAVASATVPGTAGYLDEVSITLTDDSCAANDATWIYLSTDADDATNDTATGDREVVNVTFAYTGS